MENLLLLDTDGVDRTLVEEDILELAVSVVQLINS